MERHDQQCKRFEHDELTLGEEPLFVQDSDSIGEEQGYVDDVTESKVSEDHDEAVPF
jgi:hypothetical protein